MSNPANPQKDIPSRKPGNALFSVNGDSREEHRENLLSVLDRFIVGYTEVDAEGRIIYISEGICREGGFSEEEVTGRNISDIFFSGDGLGQRDMIRELSAKAGKAPFTYEVEVTFHDGTRRWIWSSAVNRFDKTGNYIGMMAIHVDTTEQKKMFLELASARQTAEDAQRAQQQFLASMSHEIRTPLNAIIGMSYLLLDTRLDAEQDEYVKILKNASNILLGLITDILDLAKIESGKLEIKLREFDLNGLVNTLKYTFQYKLKHKPVKVTYHHDERIKNLLNGDDVLLNQVLMNLLGNAEKFTAKGEIGIEVRLLKTEGSLLWLEFKVRDTGIGIPEDKLQLIFQDFRQADQDIQRRYGGSGLGLSICKRLVELQGGTIRVESELGKGTCFTFTLGYLDTGRPVKVVSEVMRAARDETVFEGVRLLVVEDNPMNLKYLSSLMDKFHIGYAVATNGHEALAKTQENHFDLLLMDIKIPGIEGLEVARRVRNEENPNRATPIIILTATALSGTISAAREVGVNDLLTKPYTPDQLLLILKKYLLEEELEKEEPAGTDFEFDARLDTAYLRKLYGDNFEYAFDLFQLFTGCIEKELTEIAAAMNRREWEKMRALVHKIKPNFSMVGLTWITKSMQEVYDKLHTKDTASVPAMMHRILQDLDTYLPLIREEWKRLQDFLKPVQNFPHSA